jgi:hypothetical protein
VTAFTQVSLDTVVCHMRKREREKERKREREKEREGGETG